MSDKIIPLPVRRFEDRPLVAKALAALQAGDPIIAMRVSAHVFDRVHLAGAVFPRGRRAKPRTPVIDKSDRAYHCAYERAIDFFEQLGRDPVWSGE